MVTGSGLFKNVVIQSCKGSVSLSYLDKNKVEMKVIEYKSKVEYVLLDRTNTNVNVKQKNNFFNGFSDFKWNVLGFDNLEIIVKLRLSDNNYEIFNAERIINNKGELYFFMSKNDFYNSNSNGVITVFDIERLNNYNTSLQDVDIDIIINVDSVLHSNLRPSHTSWRFNNKTMKMVTDMSLLRTLDDQYNMFLIKSNNPVLVTAENEKGNKVKMVEYLKRVSYDKGKYILNFSNKGLQYKGMVAKEAIQGFKNGVYTNMKISQFKGADILLSDDYVESVGTLTKMDTVGCFNLVIKEGKERVLFFDKKKNKVISVNQHEYFKYIEEKIKKIDNEDDILRQIELYEIGLFEMVEELEFLGEGTWRVLLITNSEYWETARINTTVTGTMFMVGSLKDIGDKYNNCLNEKCAGLSNTNDIFSNLENKDDSEFISCVDFCKTNYYTNLKAPHYAIW